MARIAKARLEQQGDRKAKAKALGFFYCSVMHRDYRYINV